MRFAYVHAMRSKKPLVSLSIRINVPSSPSLKVPELKDTWGFRDLTVPEARMLSDWLTRSLRATVRRRDAAAARKKAKRGRRTDG